MSVKKFLEEIDAATSESMANEKIKPCCSKGCSTCCSEAMMADKEEARYIIEGLSGKQIEELKVKVKAWMEQFKPYQFAEVRDGLINGYVYLESDIKCPLLVGNLCGAYERRPMGCRSYFAAGNPENCKLPNRKTQLIGGPPFGHPKMRIAFDHLLSVSGVFHMDHLGVHLNNLLFNEDVSTSVTSIHSIEQYGN